MTVLARLTRHPLALGGLVGLLVVVLVVLAAPWLGLPDPDATAPARRLLPPFSDGHPLGTDALGRDLLARLVWGTRVSLAVGAVATLIAATIGSLIGLLAGFAHGRTDTVLMRGIDTVMAFPYILLALAIVAVLGPGLLNALVAIAIVNVPFFARNIRGIVLGLSRREFVDAARLAGMSPPRVMFTEVLPNVLPVIVVTMSTTFGWMILETAGLSFLGLGAQPPQADLGSMLGEGRKVMFNAPHVTVVPGLMIFALVMAVNLLGDGLRDLLDPRLRAGEPVRPTSRTTVRRDATNPVHGAGPDPSAADAPSAPVLAPESEAPLTGRAGPVARLLDVQALRTEFHIGGRVMHAVNGVDWHLSAGECLGLVGESGSGKSVSALSLMGLVPSPPGVITGGRALLHEEDLLSAHAKRLRALRGARVAHVFQDPLATLHPLFTVGAQLVEAVRAHERIPRSQARARAVALLEQVRLPNARARLDAYPHELSGGMRQRVGIAMALAHDIELLIADEPTTALDVTVQAQVLALLHDLRRERGLAMLFITHDFGVVSAICDRVAVMYAGRIVETGPADAVMRAPAHPYTAALIDCVPVLGGGRRVGDPIAGQPPPTDALPPGCAFAPRCPRVQPQCTRSVSLVDLEPGRRVACNFPLEAAGKRSPRAGAAHG